MHIALGADELAYAVLTPAAADHVPRSNQSQTHTYLYITTASANHLCCLPFHDAAVCWLSVAPAQMR